MKHKELREALVEAGWRFAKQVQSPGSLNQCDWYAWLPERPSDWPDCECNDKPPSFCIEPSVYNLTGRLHASSEFQLRGEMHGQWYDLRMYSVPLDETMQAIPTALAHLGAAWRAIAATGGKT